MNLTAGICPKCHEYLLLKNNVPFVVCPLCGESISHHEATVLLDNKCSDQANLNDLTADCIALEVQYGPELPYMILSQVVENFPQLESPTYLLTKLTGYDGGAVREYLKRFANLKSQPNNVPWAEDFLDACLNYRNMEFADLFAAYIENKIRPEKQVEYREKLAKLRSEYTFKANNPLSTKTLMILYYVSAVVNVLLLPVFMLLSGWLAPIIGMYYAINIATSILVICAEIGLLYWHHHVFGNRLGMGQSERMAMVVFMSSLVFAIGAAIMGSIWKIPLWKHKLLLLVNRCR